jgi:hypothetical protein
MLPNKQTMLRVHFLSLCTSTPSLRITSLHSQAMKSGSSLFSLKLKEEVKEKNSCKLINSGKPGRNKENKLKRKPARIC